MNTFVEFLILFIAAGVGFIAGFISAAIVFVRAIRQRDAVIATHNLLTEDILRSIYGDRFEDEANKRRAME